MILKSLSTSISLKGLHTIIRAIKCGKDLNLKDCLCFLKKNKQKKWQYSQIFCYCNWTTCSRVKSETTQSLNNARFKAVISVLFRPTTSMLCTDSSKITCKYSKITCRKIILLKTAFILQLLPNRLLYVTYIFLYTEWNYVFR